jgi:hypothetical protein
MYSLECTVRHPMWRKLSGGGVLPAEVHSFHKFLLKLVTHLMNFNAMPQIVFHQNFQVSIYATSSIAIFQSVAYPEAKELNNTKPRVSVFNDLSADRNERS